MNEITLGYETLDTWFDQQGDKRVGFACIKRYNRKGQLIKEEIFETGVLVV